MHSAGLELTKLTYTRLEDNLLRHRGDRKVYLVYDTRCTDCGTDIMVSEESIAIAAAPSSKVILFIQQECTAVWYVPDLQA